MGFRTAWTSWKFILGLTVWSSSSPGLLWPSRWDTDLKTCLTAEWEIRTFFYFKRTDLFFKKAFSSYFFQELALLCCWHLVWFAFFCKSRDKSVSWHLSLLDLASVWYTDRVTLSLIPLLLLSALLHCSLWAIARAITLCNRRELLYYTSCFWKLNSKQEQCFLPVCSPVCPLNTDDLTVQKINLFLEFLSCSAGVKLG